MFGDWNKHNDDEAQAQEANWQGWTPPWMQEGPGPRGPFGPGRGFGGPRGPFGPGRWFGGWQGPRGPFGPGFGPGGHHGHGDHGPHGPFGHGFGPGRFWGVPDEILALHAQAAEVARLFAIASRGAFENKERVSQLRSFLDRSQKELSELIYGSSQEQTSSESASGEGNVEQA